MKNKFEELDKILKESGIIKSPTFEDKINLRDIFGQRLDELNISKTNACEIIEIQSRTLNGILEGTQKLIDFTNIIKISSFLQLPKEEVLRLYIESLEENFPDKAKSSIPAEKIEFIKENFDLTALKQVGFINSITDFKQIEENIINYFGLKEVYDYKRPSVEVAFSEGKIKPKNELTRSFWIKTANDMFNEIDNQYVYNRKKLIDFFPEIRWHSTNVELGLKSVMKYLFKLGITVIFLPSFSSLHLRGATFAVNNKPCIVLTDYKRFYPTLWFALIHELFHVLFDWDEIINSKYHLTDDDVEQLTLKEKENEADNFAREYLFSKEKANSIKPFMNNQRYIEEFAKNNHVHPSFIYVFYAYDSGNNDRMAWARARRQNPDINESINFINNSWDNPKPISDFAKSIRMRVYN
jgi:HTH-type transcriptional regulator / antitoxin HigA